MKKDFMAKYLPLVLVVIALIFSVSYFHESAVTEVRDEVQSGLSAPDLAGKADHHSEIPL